MRRSPAVHRGETMRSLLRIPIKILRSALLSVQTNFTLAEIQRPARNQHTCKPDAQGRALRRRRLGHQYHLGSARRPDSGRTGGCGRVRRFQGRQPGEHRTYLRDNRLAKHVFGLDSFQGFDESVEKDIALAGLRTRRNALAVSKQPPWLAFERSSPGSASSTW